MGLQTSVMAAAGTAAATAAAAAVWWSLSSGGGAPPGGQAPAPASAEQSAPAAQGNPSRICVGADRVLFAPEQSGACGAGRRALELPPDELPNCANCDPFADPPGQDTSGGPELDAIEQRIAALENAPYFEVISKAGQPVFSIGPGGLRFYNTSGAEMAKVGTSDAGGHFTARSTATAAEISVGASGSSAGVRIVEGDLLRLELATRDGSSSLRMPSANGVIAGLGESRVGSGVLLIGTVEGAVSGTFSVNEWGGMVAVNRGDRGGASISEARIGGGLLDLADTQNNSAVRMGHLDHRYGIVIAGPVLGLPLIPKSGLPGSYFMGCGSAAPPACMPPTQ